MGIGSRTAKWAQLCAPLGNRSMARRSTRAKRLFWSKRQQLPTPWHFVLAYAPVSIAALRPQWNQTSLLWMMSKDLVQERPLPETDRHFLCPYPSPVSDTLSLVKHLLDQAERRLFAVHTWPLLDPMPTSNIPNESRL